ncbi:MAG: DUF5684 domain-containing protein [Acidimicrobiales bacterium]
MSHLVAANSAGMTIYVIFVLAIAVLEIAAVWMIFSKAGRPGWGAIIPFYNIYLMCKVSGRPGWWLILFFIPLVNIVVALIVMIDLAKAFGKGTGFGVGMFFLNFIFYPILGFGSATYSGEKAA